ncbi:hypothetical protein QFZ49_000497 [Streptomyces turgidiscabies]|uniref:Uncharacterized protein n=1 Tax=Streptomyces turgidiscabies TaxID=85558 RepID=A0ABU0RF33_9ACTN|nr:hypothetical protein [Streptomyces turgidiscabies]MDQ0930590.1 hypothetical protein [Streptomyces turgidiscabies]
MKTGMPRSTSCGLPSLRSPLEAVELGHRGVKKADLEPFGLANPAVGAGFSDAPAEVSDDITDVPSLYLALGEAINGPGGYFGGCLDALEVLNVLAEGGMRVTLA